MKLLVTLAIGGYTLGAGLAAADCTDPLVTNLQSIVSGNTVNATAVSGVGENWNEFHASDGTLYKIGLCTGNVDPFTPVGSWNVSGSEISYTYGSGSPFIFSVRAARSDGGTSSAYSFCQGNSEIARGTFSSGSSC